jgi:hypothetical protein
MSTNLKKTTTAIDNRETNGILLCSFTEVVRRLDMAI